MPRQRGALQNARARAAAATAAATAAREEPEESTGRRGAVQASTAAATTGRERSEESGGREEAVPAYRYPLAAERASEGSCGNGGAPATPVAGSQRGRGGQSSRGALRAVARGLAAFAGVGAVHAHAVERDALLRAVSWTMMGGGTGVERFTMGPTATHAPYALANTYMADRTTRPDGSWAVCGACHKDAGFARRHLVMLEPAYLRKVLACHPLEVQLLGFLDVSLDLERRMAGVVGSIQRRCILDGPLIRWDDHGRPNADAAPQHVRALLADNLATNPLFQRFETMLEVDHPSRGVPVLTARAVAGIVADAIARDPLNRRTERQREFGAFKLSAVVAAVPDLPRQPRDNVLRAGTLHLRAAGLARRMLNVDASGLNIDESFDEESITLEAALFPFLFPSGRGFYEGHGTLISYLRRRIGVLFSPFTLYHPYVLLMAQVRRAQVILNSVRETCLDRELAAFLRRNPDSTREDAVRHVIKFCVPPTVAGAAAWWRRQRNDLLALVDAYGMPQLFLTLTADDSSELRWTEYDELQDFVARFNAGLTLADAPIEAARLFYDRLRHFMRDHIVCRNSPLLGRVLHYVIRYEQQHRQTLHVHIVFWIHADDVERVSQEIVAAVPARYVAATQTWELPEDPVHRRLAQIVLRKQMHTCREDHCLQDGHCKRSFPFPPHHGGTFYHADTQRYRYFRPGYEHRNVVPYHPLVLLLWGAHLCLLRVTESSWSRYLMKYTMKADATGKLNIDPHAALELGLGARSVTELQLVSAMVLTRPITVTEAAMACLEMPLVEKSTAVDYVDSSPPHLREVAVLRGRIASPHHPVDLYCMRPAVLVDVVFTAYWRNYVVVREKMKRPGACEYIGQDRRNWHVYRRAESRVVRYTDFHPDHCTEGFFYNVLLDNVAFVRESDLLQPENQDGSYWTECELRGLADADALSKLVDEYHARKLHEREQSQQVVATLLHRREQAVRGSLQEADDLVGVDAAAQETPLPEVPPLNAEQRLVFEAVTASARGIHVVSGPPGCGKSYMVDAFLAHFSRTGRRAVVAATTGAAAARLRVECHTVHRTFGFSLNPREWQTHLRPTSPIAQRLRAADVIIIDEAYMMTAELFCCVLYRLQQVAHGHHPDAFLEEKLLLLVGDHAQLPPVCHHRPPGNDHENGVAPLCEACHISASPYYRNATKHSLQLSVRHAGDSGLAQFLNIIRARQPTSEEIREYLERCVVDDAGFDACLRDGAKVLCTHREDVSVINERALRLHFTADQIIELAPRHSAVEVPELDAWATDPSFHRLSCIAIGAPVVFTANTDVAQDAANGCTGTIVSVRRYRARISTVRVRLDDNDHEIDVHRRTIQRTWLRGQEYRRETFPLDLAYAITAHKAQGATLRSLTVVHPRRVFCPGQLYVMLSRVTDRAMLRLTRLPSPEEFVPLMLGAP